MNNLLQKIKKVCKNKVLKSYLYFLSCTIHRNHHQNESEVPPQMSWLFIGKSYVNKPKKRNASYLWNHSTDRHRRVCVCICLRLMKGGLCLFAVDPIWYSMKSANFLSSKCYLLCNTGFVARHFKMSIYLMNILFIQSVYILFMYCSIRIRVSLSVEWASIFATHLHFCIIWMYII